MVKRHLLLSAAVMALMIGGTSPAGAQYYRDYKPNDRPAVEIDMGVLDGNPVAEVEAAPLQQPAAALPSLAEPAPAPVAAAPAPTRVLKPSGPPPAAVAVQEEEPAPTPPPVVAKPYAPTAKPYRPYLTTPVAKPAPAPQVAEQEETPAPVPAPQPVRSYPPAPTPKTVEWEAPASAVAPKPVRSYPDRAPTVAEELSAEPMPEVAEQAEPPAPLPQPMPKPAVAKKYEPSPSVVDDASYRPDYSGYYKSGAPVPAAIAALEPKLPLPKPAKSEPATVLREEEIAAAPASAPKKDIAEQLTEELAPPPPLEKTAEVASSERAADELTQQLPPAQLEPLPEIATERSIEQTPPPAKPMEPIISEPKKQVKAAAFDEKKIVSLPVPRTTPNPVVAAPVQQPERKPAKIISYPDSTVIARPTGQPAPVMAPEPQFIAPAIPVEKPEEKTVSLPVPQPKPVSEPVVEAVPAPEPVVAAVPVPSRRPSLEILNTPAPERPSLVKIDGETAESILPPAKEEGKTDITKLAAEVDNAAADMGKAPDLVEPPKFAAVPTHSDLTLEFPGNSSDLTAATQRKLDAIVRQMEDLVDGGRLQVRGYAAGEDGSKSSARRIALSRALSVRSYLMDKGVKAKRVDVRAMGSETDRNPLDRVDLIFQR